MDVPAQNVVTVIAQPDWWNDKMRAKSNIEYGVLSFPTIVTNILFVTLPTHPMRGGDTFEIQVYYNYDHSNKLDSIILNYHTEVMF